MAQSLEELRAEALQFIPDNIAFRSCWKCNSAHEHLKQSNYPFACFVCGRFFYKGQDITEEGESDEC